MLSGGGARGAYEVGVVRYLVEELPRRLGRPVHLDILCGTSVGAIHACYLAATAHRGAERARQLADFWTKMRVEEVLPISARDLIRLPARLMGLRRTVEALRGGAAPERIYGLLNTRVLEQLVVRGIPWRSIRSNVREGRLQALCVTATQIATGRVVVFLEGNAPDLARWVRDPTILPRPTRMRPTHALASAAIPLLFPAVFVEGNYYADGGLRLNTPLAPALRLGADRVLVVALRQGTHEAHEDSLARHRIESYANPIFLFGKVLNALLLDPIDSDLDRLHLMNELIEDGEKAYGPDFLERVNEVAQAERVHPFKRIRDVVIRPSQDLGVVAGQVLESMDASRRSSPLLRLAVRSASQAPQSAEADLLSYLLFDGEFLAPLAELGFADAHRSEEQLCEFFTD